MTAPVSKRRRVLGIIGTVLAVLLFIFALLIVMMGIRSSRSGKPVSIFGYTYSVVATGSMSGTIEIGDFVITKPADWDTLLSENRAKSAAGEELDIILFYSEEYGRYCVHRIEAVNDDGTVMTKGDANPSPDGQATGASDFIGVVTSHGSFLGLGKIVLYHRNALFIPIILIFLYVIVSETIAIVKTVSQEKEKKAAQEALKDEDALRAEALEEVKKELARELEQKHDDKS